MENRMDEKLQGPEMGFYLGQVHSCRVGTDREIPLPVKEQGGSGASIFCFGHCFGKMAQGSHASYFTAIMGNGLLDFIGQGFVKMFCPIVI